MTTPTQPKWFDSPEKTYEVASALCDAFVDGFTDDSVPLRFIEKPWHWNKQAEIVLGWEGTQEELTDKLIEM